MRVVVADDAVLFREGWRACSPTPSSRSPRRSERAGAPGAGARGPPGHGCRRHPHAARAHYRGSRGRPRPAREPAGRPAVGIVVLSAHVEAQFALQLIEDGVRGAGYLLEERVTDLGELTDAVRRVAAGGLVIDPSVVARIVARKRVHNRLADLSDRKRDVLAVMAEGRSNQAISERLYLSPKTVEAYVRGVFTKPGLHLGADDNRRVLAVPAFLGR